MSVSLNNNRTSVLLLDGSVVDRVLLQECFYRSFPNCTLIQASSVSEAQVLLRSNRFYLYIVEPVLPDGSGIDFLADVKTVQPDAKVVVAAGVAEAEWTLDAMRMGVNAVVRKPFDEPEIVKTIHSLLQTTEHETSFSTSIRGASLLDIIQLKCLNRLSSELRITSREGVGSIYLVNGEIIHCSTERDEGVAAFYAVLSWRDGHVDDREILSAPRRTINTRWEHLCMEAAQVVDEAN